MVKAEITEDIPDMTALIGKSGAGTKDEVKSVTPVTETVTAKILADNTARLPQRVPGGLKGMSEDLDRHAREWRNTYRLLEQQRPVLEATETERDRLQDALTRIVPRVQENARALNAAIDMARKGDFSGDLSAHFTKNLTVLDELEALSEALATNLLQMRSSWEQYARTVLRAQALRDKLKSS